MGAVYRASDTSLDRQVAIKVLPDAFAADPDRLARFERERRRSPLCLPFHRYPDRRRGHSGNAGRIRTETGLGASRLLRRRHEPLERVRVVGAVLAETQHVVDVQMREVALVRVDGFLNLPDPPDSPSLP